MRVDLANCAISVDLDSGLRSLRHGNRRKKDDHGQGGDVHK
jgi:hypothetical protein